MAAAGEGVGRALAMGRPQPRDGGRGLTVVQTLKGCEPSGEKMEHFKESAQNKERIREGTVWRRRARCMSRAAETEEGILQAVGVPEPGS